MNETPAWVEQDGAQVLDFRNPRMSAVWAAVNGSGARVTVFNGKTELNEEQLQAAAKFAKRRLEQRIPGKSIGLGVLYQRPLFWRVVFEVPTRDMDIIGFAFAGFLDRLIDFT